MRILYLLECLGKSCDSGEPASCHTELKPSHCVPGEEGREAFVGSLVSPVSQMNWMQKLVVATGFEDYGVP